jgi:hypothetical protein
MILRTNSSNRSALFWGITKGNPLPTFRDGVSVKDYHSTLRSTPEERRSHEYRGGSQKSQTVIHLHVQHSEFVVSNENALCSYVTYELDLYV